MTVSLVVRLVTLLVVMGVAGTFGLVTFKVLVPKVLSSKPVASLAMKHQALIALAVALLYFLAILIGGTYAWVQVMKP